MLHLFVFIACLLTCVVDVIVYDLLSQTPPPEGVRAAGSKLSHPGACKCSKETVKRNLFSQVLDENIEHIVVFSYNKNSKYLAKVVADIATPNT